MVWYRRACAAALASFGLCALPDAVHAQEIPAVVRVAGKITQRQGITVPAEAVLTLRIEQVSGAGAAATVLAETHEAVGQRPWPIDYSLIVPWALINPRASRTLHASLTVAGEARLVAVRPVLVRPDAGPVDLLLVPPPPRVSFALPASFAGVLPCADCAGVEHTLSLRADGLYGLRRNYLGKPGDPLVELGRWRSESGESQIVLGQGAGATRFAVVDEQTLRLLDRDAQPITSAAPLALRRNAAVDVIAEPKRWRGEFRQFADAATFTDCASAYRWPVAPAGDYLAAESSAGQGRGKPGTPRLVRFEGRLEIRDGVEGGPREHIVIERFDAVEAGATCRASVAPRRAASAPR